MKIILSIGALIFILGLFTVMFLGVPWYIYHDPLLPWWFKTAIYGVIAGILVVLIAVGIEHRKELLGKEALEEVSLKEEQPQVLVQNWDEYPGLEIEEVLGLVRGQTIFAISLAKDLPALMRLIPGGELTEYTEMLGRARSVATRRMQISAGELGADAVINVRYMTASVMTGSAEVLAYGTAVKLKD
ncbi:hypothetical protein C9439_02460 [archaeon SCG-AAA382B04]|nr:hypothetical protein C9439_02460 [archaeon SCG-AAA382B04]